MIYQSPAIKVQWLEPGIAQLSFDGEGSVNKLNQAALKDFEQALNCLGQETSLKGLVVDSAKSSFIVGADITEFLALFTEPEEQLREWLVQANRVFNKLEDLPVPTIAAVNGYALGGGCEVLLACDFRVGDEQCETGVPEVKLGLLPGFGGTVRLPRVIGADNAMEWMTTGKSHKAKASLAVGLLDAVVAPAQLSQSVLIILKRAINGELNWEQRRDKKKRPLALNRTEAAMAFTTAKGLVALKAGRHYPAPHAIVALIEKAASSFRDEALQAEHEAFVSVAKSDQATALVGVFLNDQRVKHTAKSITKTATPIKQAAVVGAGIMGGGIAYQSAAKGVPIVMKDIAPNALELGLAEATKLLSNKVSSGRMQPIAMANVLNSITPTLDLGPLSNSDIIVEAVVENPEIKAKVLAELEANVSEDCIIASNTSSIRIDHLAQSLGRPERFCGMHFFNPVHKMPLVEIIRGSKTDESVINRVVQYALQMGKTPVVVNDCPGFFVNRVLFPYLAGFTDLVRDGADFEVVDKIMQNQFGWPMGPAYLLDVVGIDTAHHASDVMATGFPERMGKEGRTAIDILFDAHRFGQKNGAGFYQYIEDRKGKVQKRADPTSHNLLSQAFGDTQSFSPEQIVIRTMVPMINETVRCLEEGIIASPAEADIALLYGLGFPPFRGGVFRYLDALGLDQYIAMAEGLAELGPLYRVSAQLKTMATEGRRFYSDQ